MSDLPQEKPPAEPNDYFYKHTNFREVPTKQKTRPLGGRWPQNKPTKREDDVNAGR